MWDEGSESLQFSRVRCVQDDIFLRRSNELRYPLDDVSIIQEELG